MKRRRALGLPLAAALASAVAVGALLWGVRVALAFADHGTRVGRRGRMVSDEVAFLGDTPSVLMWLVVVALACALLLGAPAHLLLKRLKRRRRSAYAAAGLATGIVGGGVVSLPFLAVVCQWGCTGGMVATLVGPVFLTGVLASVCAFLAFWAVRRPDLDGATSCA